MRDFLLKDEVSTYLDTKGLQHSVYPCGFRSFQWELSASPKFWRHVLEPEIRRIVKKHAYHIVRVHQLSRYIQRQPRIYLELGVL